MDLSFWCVYRVICLADSLNLKNLLPFPYFDGKSASEIVNSDKETDFQTWILMAEGYYEALGLIRNHLTQLGVEVEMITISKEMLVSFRTSANGDQSCKFIFLAAIQATFSGIS